MWCQSSTASGAAESGSSTQPRPTRMPSAASIYRALHRVRRQVRRQIRHCLVLVLALTSLALGAQPPKESAVAASASPAVSFRSAAERPAPALPVEPYVPATWSFEQGARLRPTLQRWAVAAGWQVLWRFDGDVELHVSAKWSGTFSNSVRNLVAALPPSIGLTVELNTGINPALVIVDRVSVTTQTSQKVHDETLDLHPHIDAGPGTGVHGTACCGSTLRAFPLQPPTSRQAHGHGVHECSDSRSSCGPHSGRCIGTCDGQSGV